MSEDKVYGNCFLSSFLRSKTLFIQEFLSINGDTHNIKTYQMITQYILSRYVHIVILFLIRFGSVLWIHVFLPNPTLSFQIVDLEDSLDLIRLQLIESMCLNY